MSATNLLAIFEHTVSALGGAHFDRTSGSYAILGEAVLNAEGYLSLVREMVAAGVVDVSAVAEHNGVAAPGCSYFAAQIPERYEAYEAAMLLTELDAAQLREVRARIGYHGTPELYAKGLPFRPTDVAHIIVGPHEGAQVVYTWYPGRLTPPMGTVKLERREVAPD